MITVSEAAKLVVSQQPWLIGSKSLFAYCQPDKSEALAQSAGKSSITYGHQSARQCDSTTSAAIATCDTSVHGLQV